MPYLYSPRRYADSVTTIQRLAEEGERDLGGFGWYAFLFVTVDRDRERAVEGAARGLGGTYNQDFSQMIGSVAIAGTPDDVTRQVNAFVEAGADHLIVAPQGDPTRTVDLFASEVLPRVGAN
jgi:alkanesulfonate monooxygenase SsuD/methylene tetrahydromethanopterin reductase-like flavin-dependent oxidoreductase (luciferase family)